MPCTLHRMHPLLAIATLLVTPGLARADDRSHDDGSTLHSSTIYGGVTQDGALVYVRNVTNRSVRLSNKRIVGEDGTALSIDYDTCGDRIAPGRTCVYYNETAIVEGRAYAASITVKGAPAHAVRAQLELRCSFDDPAGPLARDNLR